MKLNLSIQSYDVKNLEAIRQSVASERDSCRRLEQSAEIIRSNIAGFEREFSSVNMDRAKEIVDKYIRVLSDAQAEIAELLGSADEFMAKLRHVWRKW